MEVRLSLPSSGCFFSSPFSPLHHTRSILPFVRPSFYLLLLPFVLSLNCASRASSSSSSPPPPSVHQRAAVRRDDLRHVSRGLHRACRRWPLAPHAQHLASFLHFCVRPQPWCHIGIAASVVLSQHTLSAIPLTTLFSIAPPKLTVYPLNDERPDPGRPALCASLHHE